MLLPKIVSSAGPIDQKAFWRGVGMRATGSTVVTAYTDAGPAGFLGLSATHVSADPPMMLVAVDKRTSALPAMLEAGHFAINYLSSEQASIADAFAGKTAAKGQERFESASWGVLTTGAPVLMECIGAIDCSVSEHIERNGVCIVFGRVLEIWDGERNDPLVHFRGRFLPWS
jgi:flavin reductase (DIM6/NTAB) family NADH-FMN oxidoreductase RutF